MTPMLILWITITVLVAMGYCLAVVKVMRSQLGRSGILAFLIAGGALAFIRGAGLWFVNSRLQTHTYTVATTLLSYLVLPEGVVMDKLSIHDLKWDLILFMILLTLGSFFWTFPLLLIGSKRKAKRS